MNRKELLESKEYWVAKIQQELYEKLTEYMEVNNLSKTQLAEQLNFSKGYISQLLNGDFDHKISKLVELSLAIDKVPSVNLDIPLSEYIATDKSMERHKETFHFVDAKLLTSSYKNISSKNVLTLSEKEPKLDIA